MWLPECWTLRERRPFPPDRVRLEVADAFAPENIVGDFTTAFAGFWWSHIRREELSRFLGALHRRVGAGARVAFCDNRYVAGSSTPIARTAAAADTYQQRRLERGESYEVVKDFPSAAELERVIRTEGGSDVSLVELTYYWCVTYRVGAVFL